MSSTRSIASSDSLRLAPVMRTASGVPLPSTNRCRLVPSFPRSVGFLPVKAPKNSAEALAVHAAVAPVDALLLPDPLEEGAEEFLPDAPALPVPQPPPAGDAGAAAHLLGEHLPRDAAPQDEDNPRQAGSVIDRGPTPSAGAGLMPREEWCDRFPEFIGDQRLSHGCTSIPVAPSTGIVRCLFL